MRFDLRVSFDVRDSGSGESRVKESRVESRIGESRVVGRVVHEIGIDSIHEFPSINGATPVNVHDIGIEEFHEDRH